MSAKMKFGAQDHVCANCHYFDKFPIQKKEDNVLGACHANPPQPAPESYEEGSSKLGVWPLVLGNFWCGVFSKKDKES